ncbi:PrsW family glutamic-type intramembrane protease [Methanopyrus sp. SNP6]|uniref:PrsW family glutamic-type intramembrane protease n=1 Tax=Methanopyrus sp. SNP6 TaxID=1937005 RepID=UPI0011E5FCA4|nr:PrsW family glutamic-type intramembrane protease [Methanopyrus sp. SNP6]
MILTPVIAVIGVLLGLLYAPISVVIAFLVETVLTSGLNAGPHRLVIAAVVVAPIVEELSKGLGFLVVPRVLAGSLRLASGFPVIGPTLEAAANVVRECGRRPVGIVTVAATTALGFGSIENVFYALVGLKFGPLGPIIVGFLRTFTSLPIHVIATSSFGLLYGFLRRRWLGFTLGYSTAISIHAAFNFAAVYARYKVAHGLIGT